ncbi:MAG: hypothetical protein ACD_57C00172G0003 [uncultured bacterium]|uniref:Uncharacterized protein n=1 Tax=Candidatus Curtissbacteria bacterium RIFOXYA1_FULL_41_14 TaxID=1797737 RepID=A0A1F5HFH9_9BACT|nr:MAG: hypothetical protein ACD_57C00172G0003 [uncultured bacterium]KKR56021.1 MAG: hypothetical protein UT95_C0057G0018 [Candidatus Curtissbacteria bacterium GW2011_GWB1_40_28]KKR61319.1 MAG: hypothetical protein UU00_C0016G0001 [Microgenomates group bacterium GW2011_GWC1_40_35]KKR64679.1 MAG: hypothetical protein UU05_C0045G0016 [Candidatus Curtissbacteria bacterium GW2011_GWA1_40_47]KKS01344.1 MAG: hypothetical protein UU53_C0014G0031 [Candidatus Curtissbacteria bacterium GW2011_GWC2_41_21]
METLKICASLILSSVLYLGGVVLVTSRIPYWGQFLGVPSTIFGFGFIVLTFDKLNQLTLEDEVDKRPLSKPSLNPSFFATWIKTSSKIPKIRIRKSVKKKAIVG